MPSVFIFGKNTLTCVARDDIDHSDSNDQSSAKKTERVGFEPTSRQAHYPFSRRVPSTAQAPLRLDGNASMTLEANLVNDGNYGITPLTPWWLALRESILFSHRPGE